MTICRILVVDDELRDNEAGSEGARLETYCSVCDCLSKQSTALKFSFEYAESGADALEKIRNYHFDFFFLDAVLERKKWNGGISFDSILSEISDRGPFFLITSRFDATNHESVHNAIKSKGFVNLFRWPIFEEFDEYVGYVYTLILRETESFRESVGLQRGISDSLTILHISDIQIGGYPDENDKFEAQITALRVKESTGGKPPDFVVLSGDITQSAMPKQYDGALDWLNYLFGLLGFPLGTNSRVFTVPGNHDVNISLGASGLIHYLGKESENAECLPVALNSSEGDSSLVRYAYAPYTNFESRLVNRTLRLRNSAPGECQLSWAENRFGPLGLLFYGLNTARPILAGKGPMREVSEEEVADLAHWLDENARIVEERFMVPAFIIGVLHHSPYEGNEDRSIANPRIMKGFLGEARQTHLIMNGHVHEQAFDVRTVGRKNTVVSVAPTATLRTKAREEDTLRGFNVLTLKRKDGAVIRLEAASFQWLSTTLSPIKKEAYNLVKGQWQQDLAHI